MSKSLFIKSEIRPTGRNPWETNYEFANDHAIAVLKEDGSPLLAKALTLGEETSCAIDINDQLFCFGRNLHGLYGLDNNNPSSVAKPIPSATDVKQADLTWHHLVWLKNDGSVYGAGQNDYKQLQDGSTSDIRTPIQLFTDVTTTSRKHELMRVFNW